MPQPVQQPGPGDGQLLLSLCVDEPGRLDLLHLHHHLLVVGRQVGRLQLELELQSELELVLDLPARSRRNKREPGSTTWRASSGKVGRPGLASL